MGCYVTKQTYEEQIQINKNYENLIKIQNEKILKIQNLIDTPLDSNTINKELQILRQKTSIQKEIIQLQDIIELQKMLIN
jgi:hypothetical protein